MPFSVHVPVLLEETLDLLQPRSGGCYVDGTLGGGGHAEAILERSSPGGRLLGFDLDPEALERVRERLQPFGDRFVEVHASFAELERWVRWFGFTPTDGIVLDLGLSSDQLADLRRGFTFQAAAPLDMRFNPVQSTQNARDLVNRLDLGELSELLYRYGEEPRAKAIARAIVQQRQRRPIETTDELAALIERAVGHRRGKTHPATRTFQALRIAVNEELAALESALPQAIEVLGPGGRLVVISFHSLEDRIVKRFFVDQAATCVCPPGLPICVCGRQPRVKILTKHAVRASAEEIARNSRSRSAVLRAVEKLSEPG
ncbi:MAG TPA: 16S rRNA (cytosine(1402)-N(4))-methyltransferase RsmH [Chloroflexota bacterium]|nr:16S rRNA (cytosine(1402)-N(4))-methyltransferase RsmH [Chloroflexota bacterium]